MNRWGFSDCLFAAVSNVPRLVTTQSGVKSKVESPVQSTGGSMAREHNKLNDRKIRSLKEPQRYGDGGNLYLFVTDSGRKVWSFMFTRRGESREQR